MPEDLKKRRIELGKSLDEISEHTKIKKSYLAAIEEGNWKDLPLEIFTKSYIKIYSEILGVNPKKHIEEYENYLATLEQSKRKEEVIEKKQKRSREKSHWKVSMVITLIVFTIILALLYLDRREYQIPPPPPPPEDVKPLIQENVKIQEESAEKKESTVNNLKIEAIDQVWMRIVIDDQETKEYLLEKGQKISLQGIKNFKLHIGNAGGVRVSFNDEYLGKIGESGQVVHLKLPKD